MQLGGGNRGRCGTGFHDGWRNDSLNYRNLMPHSLTRNVQTAFTVAVLFLYRSHRILGT